jgi:hypothetical protein
MAHPVDPALEVATVVTEIDATGSLLKVSGRITLAFSPLQAAVQKLEDLTKALKDMAWRRN